MYMMIQYGYYFSIFHSLPVSDPFLGTALINVTALCTCECSTSSVSIKYTQVHMYICMYVGQPQVSTDGGWLSVLAMLLSDHVWHLSPWAAAKLNVMDLPVIVNECTCVSLRVLTFSALSMYFPSLPDLITLYVHMWNYAGHADSWCVQ